MAERIQVSLDSRVYFISPLKKQHIEDGVINARTRYFKRVKFYVDSGDRHKVTEAIKKIEEYLQNPHLAITDRLLTTWMEDFGSSLIPPVEVVGPPQLVRQEP